jgi:hypothetical protein
MKLVEIKTSVQFRVSAVDLFVTKYQEITQRDTEEAQRVKQISE